MLQIEAFIMVNKSQPQERKNVYSKGHILKASKVFSLQKG